MVSFFIAFLALIVLFICPIPIRVDGFFDKKIFLAVGKKIRKPDFSLPSKEEKTDKVGKRFRPNVWIKRFMNVSFPQTVSRKCTVRMILPECFQSELYLGKIFSEAFSSSDFSWSVSSGERIYCDFSIRISINLFFIISAVRQTLNNARRGKWN